MIGDLAHHPVLLVETPRSQFLYDLDPQQAGETQVKALGILSKERMALFGVHFPWHGIGHIASEKDSFQYFPEAIRWASSTIG